ncbi:hypothetical protein ACFFRS_27410, partial [Saccharopolyspora hordei]
GSSDERALADVRTAARLLGLRCGQRLVPSYVSTARPATAEVCRPGDVVAPYLLAPGLFHRRLAGLPVAGVADPIGDHPAVVELLARRYQAAWAEAGTRAGRVVPLGTAGYPHWDGIA